MAKTVGKKPAPPKIERRSTERRAKKIEVAAQKVVDTVAPDHVDSSQLEDTTSDAPASDTNTGGLSPQGNTATHIGEKNMKLVFTLDTKQRKSTSLVYGAPAGSRGSIRIAKTLFAKDAPPATLEIESESFAQPKSKMTAEERKAARKAAPKLSPAEKLDALRKRAAALEAKIAAASASAPV